MTLAQVGPVNSHNAMIPLHLIFSRTNVVSTSDEVWARAIFSTGQPDFLPSAALGGCELADGSTVYGGCTIDVERLNAAAEGGAALPGTPSKINW